MLFSPSARYAIRALSHLAGCPPRKPVQVAGIAEDADIPAKFLSKIFLMLKKAGYVKAVRGPGGGYYLERDPAALTVYDIVRAVDGPEPETRTCVLGLDNCSDLAPCPLHFEWKRLELEVEDRIHRLTLTEVAEKLREKQALANSERR